MLRPGNLVKTGAGQGALGRLKTWIMTERIVAAGSRSGDTREYSSISEYSSTSKYSPILAR